MRFGRTNLVRIFLATATLALLSVYSYYYACEWMAKWAFAHQSYFAADELILLTFPRTDLSRQNEFLVIEGEFEWRGEMVDVIHREFRADTLYIYGFRDKAETKLRQEAAWLYSDTAHPDHQPLSARSHTEQRKWFGPFVLPRPEDLTRVAGSVLSLEESFFVYSPLRIGLPLLEVLAPPPNL